MPGPFSFTKYFKKTPQSSTASQSSDQGSVNASSSQSSDNGSTQTTTTVTSSTSAAPYSGIGNPPSQSFGASPPPPTQSAQISGTTPQGTVSAQASTQKASAIDM